MSTNFYFQKLLDLDTPLDTIVSSEEIDNARKVLNIIRDYFYKESEWSINFNFRGNLFYKKKYKHKKRLFVSFYDSEWSSVQKFTLNDLITNKTLLSQLYTNQLGKIDLNTFLNNKWTVLLKNIEEKFKDIKLQKRLNRHGKKNTPYKNFYAAVKTASDSNRYKTSMLIKVIYPFFNIKKGTFISYDLSDYEKIDWGKIIKSPYLISNLNSNMIDIYLYFNEIYSQLKKNNLSSSVIGVWNLMYKFFNLYNLLDLSGRITNVKFFALNLMENFDSEKNIRLLLILNSEYFDIVKKDMVSEYFFNDTVLNFNDFQYKRLPSHNNYNVLLHSLIKKKHYRYRKDIKYKKKLETPISYFIKLYSGESSKVALDEKEETFFEKFFLNRVIKRTFGIESSDYITETEIIGGLFHDLSIIKDKNKLIHSYLIENLHLSKHTEIFPILKSHGNNISIEGLEHYINEKQLLSEGKLPDFYEGAKYPFEHSLMGCYGLQKNDLWEFRLGGSRLDVLYKSLNYYIEDHFKEYLYHKLSSDEINMFLVYKMFGSHTFSIRRSFIDFIADKKFTKKQIYLLFLMFHVENRNHLTLLMSVYSYYDRTIFDMILNIFYIFIKDSIINFEYNSFRSAIHNFCVTFLYDIKDLIENEDIDNEILKKIVSLIKAQSTLFFFENLDLKLFISFNKYNKPAFRKKFLKATSFSELKNIIKSEAPDFKKVRKLLKGNPDILPLVHNNNAESDVIYFLKNNSHEENIMLQKHLHNEISVEVRGDKDLVGHLGSTVKGVCIRTSSSQRDSHLNKGYLNLIVRDNDRIYLWGLLMNVQHTKNLEHSFLLNNLQGSIPTKYKKSKMEISEAIVQILKELDRPVYSYNHSFNSIQLPLSPVFRREYFFIDKNVRMDYEYAYGYDVNDKKLLEKKDVIYGHVSKITKEDKI